MNGSSRWTTRGPVLLALAWLAGAPLAVAPQRLVQDIDPNTSAASSRPDQFVRVGTTVYFVAEDSLHGRELWKHDGSVTDLVRDIVPGPQGSNPSELVELGGELFFVATDLRVGTELWCTDGTPRGTVVFDLEPGSASSSPSDLLVAQARLLFSARDSTHGRELWSSDGTEQGTSLLADIQTGSADSSPRHLAAAGNTVYFSASTSGIGTELWKTDGTAQGTVLVRDIIVSGSSSPHDLVGATTQVFFQTFNNNNRELWRSDGTAQGTQRLLGVGTRSIAHKTALGADLIFVAQDSNLGLELWKSDGTQTGTVVLKDIWPGRSSSAPEGIVRIGTQVFFSAIDGIHGRELWRSDGSQSGTVLVADVVPGFAGSSPCCIERLGSHLFFSADVFPYGRELWKSDESDRRNVALVRDINPGLRGSAPNHLLAAGGSLLLAADDGRSGTEPWISDGAADGTQRLLDIHGGANSSSPEEFVRMDELLYFRASEPSVGQELWVSDGTESGTQLLVDADGRQSDSFVSHLTPGLDRLFFIARNTSGDNAIWSTDGTPGGTVEERDSRNNRLIDVTSLERIGLFLYYVGRSHVGRLDLISRERMTVWSGTGVGELGVVGNTVFFRGCVSGSGCGTYAHDDAGGVRRVYRDGGSRFNPAGSLMFFLSGSSRLVRSDGTMAGTFELPGQDVSELLPVGPNLFYAAGGELWITDGASAGSSMVRDINPSGDSDPRDFAAAADRLFFTADDGSHGRELWVSDGTTAGTFMVVDLLPGPESSVPSQLAQAGSGRRVVFSATDGDSGIDVWTSDGTAAGTFVAADLAPRSRSSSPSGFVSVGTTVFCAASDLATGRELWSFPLTLTEASLVETFGEGCAGTGGRIPFLDPAGLPHLGNAAFAVGLRDAAWNAPTALVLSLTRGDVPLGGACTLHPALLGIVLSTTTSPFGWATLSVPVPGDQSFLGAELFAQWVIADPEGAALGVATVSDALHILIGR